MNNVRRKKIKVIFNSISDCLSDLQLILDDEREAFDNIPFSLWETERYEIAENAVDNLDNAVSGLEEILECLEESMS